MKKKLIIISTITIVLILVGIGLFYYFTKQDKNTSLNIMEKQWIENNKSKLIDFQIINNVPILNYDGEGIVFDFLESLSKNTNLKFNELSYQYNTKPTSEYSISIVNKKANNDILIYSDNYVIVSNNKNLYNNIEEISDLTIGTINNDLDNANKYLKNAKVTYSTFDNYEKLFEEINKPETGTNKKIINAIIVPKTLFLREIVSNDKLYINYNITEMSQDYIIKLGRNDKLNNILTKYYKKWASEEYDKSYNNHLSESYLNFVNVDEKQRVDFRSKRYKYGFISNNPYDNTIDGKLYGINNSLLQKFADIANIEINFTNYSSIKDLLDKFNANKIDVIFNNSNANKYQMDVYNTVSPFTEKIVIASQYGNDLIINSVNSLANYEVSVLKNSKIETYLIENNVKVKSYNDINGLLKSKNTNKIIAIDLLNYNFYSNKLLKMYKQDYIFDLQQDYFFTIRDINENKLFSSFYNFFLSFYPTKTIMSDGYYDLYNTTNKTINKNLIILIILGIIVLLIIYFVIKIFKKKEKKEEKLTKEDKLKYIDLLTSLKNRNYLNSKIETWDESEVYPQSIIMIDLNNVAYINDNYGHQEGDKIIKDAANILILNQLENSDIIRTNGNEFLIYLVGYEEKDIVAYIRKLTKEFKELEHGFGAALGYSMINDAIKTIDDAVNEATIEMKNNKEELK